MSKKHFEIGDVIGKDTPLPQTHAHLKGWVVFNTNPITHEASIIEPPSSLKGSWDDAQKHISHLNHLNKSLTSLPTEENAYAIQNACTSDPTLTNKIGLTENDYTAFWGTKTINADWEKAPRLYHFNTISLSPEPHPEIDTGYIRAVQQIRPDLIFN